MLVTIPCRYHVMILTRHLVVVIVPVVTIPLCMPGTNKMDRSFAMTLPVVALPMHTCSCTDKSTRRRMTVSTVLVLWAENFNFCTCSIYIQSGPAHSCELTNLEGTGAGTEGKGTSGVGKKSLQGTHMWHGHTCNTHSLHAVGLFFSVSSVYASS